MRERHDEETSEIFAVRSMPVNIWRDARRRAGKANPRVNPGCSTLYDIAARFKTLF